MSEHRLIDWQLYAVHAEKTMTQVMEELIDSLPNIENSHSSSIFNHKAISF
ncbi:hypothetical protein NIES4072_51170 [Nostoc commune NIES-4072]|uniref:Uncharacterized protein n=1 Tax=Nostoc commune NIES-4072 TaxID=2005467 RepID=A0A2R5FYW3_NOSCO|nr:hypothetical protein NIES4070_39780 [Nostoc commune HK-02]GBG21433.1 hypothetical protein NIES4072_51170 [Nostoc commune NIES-4072]